MTALAMLDHLATLDIELIPIDGHHAAAVETLPLHHRDPFDRLLVAQAKVETAVLLTQDGALAIYGDFVLLV